MATIGTLERVSAATLSKLILAEKAAAAGDPAVAVIDVRDDGEYATRPASHLPTLPSPPRPASSHYREHPKLTSSIFSAMIDFIGGHIKGAQNVPSRTLDAMLPSLVRQLKDKETVVFHCALSQQRGPSAALQYLRERERLLPSLEKTGSSADAAAAAGNEVAGATEGKDGETKKKEQKVYVLDRGFVGWQELYGTDERLTEAYRKELWENGY